VVPRGAVFGAALGLGRRFKPLLPQGLAAKVSPAAPAGPGRRHATPGG
jgi:hypothetical protein